MKSFCYLLFLFGITFSCKEKNNPNYTQNPKVSDRNGNAIDSAKASYFPMINDTSDLVWQRSGGLNANFDSLGMDFFLNKEISKQLKVIDEPILSNYFLNKEIYRLFWHKSFDYPVTLVLIKDGEEVTFITKKTDKIPIANSPEDSVRIKEGRKTKFFINSAKKLSNNEWNYFEKLLKNCRFDSLPSEKESMGLDGSTWILEKHKNNGYKYVHRWRGDEIRKACEYLLDLSDVKNEERY
jgi:hypothetical protein